MAGSREEDRLTLVDASGPSGCIFLFLALFSILWWSGLIHFIGVVAKSFIHEGFNLFAIFLGVFLIPFLIVGLLIGGSALYMLLKIFAPYPVVWIYSKQGVIPGESFTTEWLIRRRNLRLNDLKLTLVGREEAAKRVGTSTQTERREFLRIELLALAPGEVATRGRLSVELPADIFPTFKGENNKVIYYLEMAGNFTWKFYPSLHYSFELPILSQRDQN